MLAVVALPGDRLDGRAARAVAEIGAAFAQSRLLELAELERAVPAACHLSIVGAWLAGLLRAPTRPLLAPLPVAQRGEIGVSWIGHATCRLAWERLTMLTDPMLGGHVGLARRAVRLPIAPAELSDVDLVIISAADRDHLHWPTLRRLPRSATIVVPPGAGRYVSPLGFAQLVELAPWASMPISGGGELTALPALHLGPAGIASVSYMIRGLGPSVLFSGAGGYGPHWADVGRRFRPDVAILPAGGFAPHGLGKANMSPAAALFAFEDVGARLLVPVRHATFLRGYDRLGEAARLLALLAERRGLAGNLQLMAPGQSEIFEIIGD
jgi:L-ascorbate metabolism protein UlaG (beta-lactamase superfamily)